MIYLGNGFALTARHVGMGEVFLRGEIVPPVAGSKRTLLNANGTPADAMIFEVALPEGFEDLPPAADRDGGAPTGRGSAADRVRTGP